MALIKIEIKHVGYDDAWHEEYDCRENDPNEWANDLINNFNNTLRAGERAREVVGVEVLDCKPKQTEADHDWYKTNAVTIIKGISAYDTMKCENCGITGKRFGLAESIVRDSKYKAKKYEKCSFK